MIQRCVSRIKTIAARYVAFQFIVWAFLIGVLCGEGIALVATLAPRLILSLVT